MRIVNVHLTTTHAIDVEGIADGLTTLELEEALGVAANQPEVGTLIAHMAAGACAALVARAETLYRRWWAAADLHFRSGGALDPTVSWSDQPPTWDADTAAMAAILASIPKVTETVVKSAIESLAGFSLHKKDIADANLALASWNGVVEAILEMGGESPIMVSAPGPEEVH